MKYCWPVLVLALVIGAAWSAPPARPAAKKAAVAKAPVRRAAPSVAARKAAPQRVQPGRYRRARYVAPRPVLQAQPTTDRYKEIQQALIDRGHLKGEATGVWNAESIAALKSFQQEQQLDGSGKLDARSLIALGLGPKRTTAQLDNK